MPQSLSSILIHLIFSTKRRESIISPDIEAELHAYIATVLREYKSPAILIKGTRDHRHILFALSRTATVSDIVEEMKKRSSKLIKTKGSEYRNFQWQTGYGAFSIGQSNVAALKK
jgi:REP element-mobilizing transposase RayT